MAYTVRSNKQDIRTETNLENDMDTLTPIFPTFLDAWIEPSEISKLMAFVVMHW